MSTSRSVGWEYSQFLLATIDSSRVVVSEPMFGCEKHRCCVCTGFRCESDPKWQDRMQTFAKVLLVQSHKLIITG